MVGLLITRVIRDGGVVRVTIAHFPCLTAACVGDYLKSD
jgi:hypothetical protein